MDQTGFDPTYQYQDPTAALRVAVVALSAICAVLVGGIVLIVRWLLT